QAQYAARQIEKDDRFEKVEGAHQPHQAAFLLGALHEAIEVGECVENDVQPGQAEETNEQDRDKLPQNVAVDDLDVRHPKSSLTIRWVGCWCGGLAGCRG